MLYIINIQKLINNDAIKLLRIKSIKESIPDNPEINHSNRVIKNNNTIKIIDIVKNGLTDSRYFFIISLLACFDK